MKGCLFQGLAAMTQDERHNSKPQMEEWEASVGCTQHCEVLISSAHFSSKTPLFPDEFDPARELPSKQFREGNASQEKLEDLISRRELQPIRNSRTCNCQLAVYSHFQGLPTVQPMSWMPREGHSTQLGAPSNLTQWTWSGTG